MHIDNPTPADITKLHAEVNQYINQRLVITTTAITIFGVSIGWLVFGSSNANSIIEVKTITFLLPTILLVVMFVLFVYCQVILSNIRIIVGYLRATNQSAWESAYQSFYVQNRHINQYDMIPMMFLVLGLCVGSIVILLWMFFPQSEGNDFKIGVFSTIFILSLMIYLSSITLAWAKLFLNFGFKDQAYEKWIEFFKEEQCN